MTIAPQRAVGLDALVPESRAGGEAAIENPVVLEIGADGGFRLNTVAVARGIWRGEFYL